MRRNLLIGVAVVVALVAAVAVISAGKDSKRADAPAGHGRRAEGV
jgi:xanthine dehydrogenase molybdopterin-binding subunit B